MLLQDWLSENGLSNGQFGARISRTAEAVRRYASGERIPDRETMTAIVGETGGAVLPNDFYGLAAHELADTADDDDASSGKSEDLTAAQQSEAA